MKTKAAKLPKYTIKDFQAQFPNDDVCLEWLKNHLYPNGITCKNCEKVTPHHRIAKRRSYSCDYCGNHVHPTADTIYHKSPTPLTLWFYATYLMASTRCGISAKHLQRELGVTYKCAWRMAHQIRKSMTSGGKSLSGIVEADETYIGGKRSGKRGRGAAGKTPVIGVLERGGSVIAKAVSDVRQSTIIPHINQTVEKGSRVITDEFHAYKILPRAGYSHEAVNHAGKEYVRGLVHTNSIEGFWSQLKRSVHGTFHHVSRKHLQKYVDEFCFRYNHRNGDTAMFTNFLFQLKKASC